MSHVLHESHRFRRVVGSGVVADILGGVEHSEGEPGQEVSGGEEAGNRAQLEPGHTCSNQLHNEPARNNKIFTDGLLLDHSLLRKSETVWSCGMESGE